MKAVESWESEDRRGVVKAVIGAGKTIMALLSIEGILREHEDNRVSMGVPTLTVVDHGPSGRV